MQNKYDLQKRTLDFGIATLNFYRLQKQDAITKPLVSQLVRSATSVGANYNEAIGASSKKDFKNKIFICKKEAQETRYWLELFDGAGLDKSEDLRLLLKEIEELIKIFHTIAKNTST